MPSAGRVTLNVGEKKRHRWVHKIGVKTSNIIFFET